jgi:flagellar biosynthesis anti-sigma factor FlgM
VIPLNDVTNDNAIRYVRKAYTPITKNAVSACGVDPAESAVASNNQGKQQDEVSISPLSQKLHRQMRVREANSATREEKIARLRHLIANGEYYVSNEALAQKFIEYYIGA